MFFDNFYLFFLWRSHNPFRWQDSRVAPCVCHRGMGMEMRMRMRHWKRIICQIHLHFLWHAGQRSLIPGSRDPEPIPRCQKGRDEIMLNTTHLWQRQEAVSLFKPPSTATSATTTLMWILIKNKKRKSVVNACPVSCLFQCHSFLWIIFGKFSFRAF